MSEKWEELLAHAPTFKVFRYQNADLDKNKLFALVTSPMFAGVEFLDLRRNFRSPDDELMAELVLVPGRLLPGRRRDGAGDRLRCDAQARAPVAG